MRCFVLRVELHLTCGQAFVLARRKIKALQLSFFSARLHEGLIAG